MAYRTFRELMTDIVRDNVQIARGELGTNTMDLLKEIGHNFHTFFNDENMSGNWSTYAYEGPLEERGAMQLCSTLERKKEVPNNVRVRFGLKEMIEGDTTWVIKVVPPDSAIHLFQEGDSSARIWTVNPGHFFTVSVDVEEFQFLSTRTTPCESDPSYSYHQCITRCVTDQWMDPKTWSNLEQTNFAPGSAMLEIRSVQSLRPVFKEVWNYEFGQMVAEIGGNLGMFLGFSFLGSVGWILQDKLRKMVG
ncbi:unnamed protein product [Cyprideis torosa]|uniref:Uncharacterized protein n=1 Tax=Cyprideis torosa TaxID=163714 RepID=A0A7R8ZR29_9CRUS|nr:unnamed protein product [Cyprideis torosa]CAG0904258.1 unnamed protein product [Cyprideis torosa]